MSVLARLALIVALIVIVVAAARLIARWQRPPHPSIDLGDFGPRPGLVVFTSTDCSNCKEALAVAGDLGVEVREVAWELEPAVQEAVGVEAVPLTAVVDADGNIEALMTGVPKRGPLERAVRRAGLRA
jgi:hypothetical protein